MISRFRITHPLTQVVLTLALFALCAIAAQAQLQQSGGPGSSVSITQGGNTATVDAGGALKTNIGEVGGTTVDTNSGSKSAGTLRVVIATDQPALTNKLLVTPDANSAVNIGQINGVTPLMGNGTTGTGSQRVTIASDNTAFPVNAAESGTWTVQPGNTANTTPWLVKTAPSTTCGTTAVSQALAAVPTSSTAVFSSTTCLIAAYFNNTNASAQTATLTDNAGTPINGVGPAFSIPGLSNMTIPLYGIPFTTGVKWSAGGTGVTGGMIGYQ